jgi:hypothetical protein
VKECEIAKIRLYYYKNYYTVNSVLNNPAIEISFFDVCRGKHQQLTFSSFVLMTRFEGVNHKAILMLRGLYMGIVVRGNKGKAFL